MKEEEKQALRKMQDIQNELVLAKNKTNDFGHYNYRNVEVMLTEIKSVLKKYNSTLQLNNELIENNGVSFIKSTATYIDIDNDYKQESTAYAAIDFEKKGMDMAQCVGASQTYAEKYSLNSLFLIDDGSLDPDAQMPKNYTSTKQCPTESLLARKDALQTTTTANTENKPSKFIDVSEIRQANTIDELKRIYTKLNESNVSEKQMDFLMKELTTRKQHLNAKNVKSIIK